MAWQRKIPFGYRMERGEIVPHPQEAEAVVFIYNLYCEGESYRSIAAAMGDMGIRYHAATAEWNKHMIKRMLENPRYAGQEPYPAIVPTAVWRAAQAVRERKTGDYQGQTPCVAHLKRRMLCGECGAPFRKHAPTNATGNRWWRCSNPECGGSLKRKDAALEDAVTALLNRIIVQPELLGSPTGGDAPLSLEAGRLQNEINRELGRLELDEEALTALIFTCAAERYAMLDGSVRQQGITRAKAALERHSPLTAFDPAVFDTACEALLVHEGGALALRLIGGAILHENGKENPTYADTPQDRH